MTPQPKYLSHVYTHKRCGSVVIGDLLYARGGSFGPRTQMDYQLVVIHSGSLTLTLDHEILEVPENHGILLSPGHEEYFSFASDRETHHSWVAVAPCALSPQMRNSIEVSRGPVPFLGRMARLLDLARIESVPFNGEDSLKKNFYLGLAIAILCDFSSVVSEGRKAARASETVLWQMERFIAESCGRHLELNDIARACGVSRQHLLKLCRAAGTPTPMKQLYAKRLEVAEDLLLHTGFSVAEIAEQCGFVNQFHFSRRFKQGTGSSPLSWRSQLWKHSLPKR